MAGQSVVIPSSWGERLFELVTVRLAKFLALLTLVGVGVLYSPARMIWGAEMMLNRADPADARLVALGATVYTQHCAACHGDKLQGQPNWRERKPNGRLPAPPHDETGHTWHHPDAFLFLITKNGLRPPLAPKGYESDMPAYDETLNDREIWAVLSFIMSTWPPEQEAYQEKIDDAFRNQAN